MGAAVGDACGGDGRISRVRAQEVTKRKEKFTSDAPDTMFGAFFLFPDSFSGGFVPMELTDRRSGVNSKHIGRAVR